MDHVISANQTTQGTSDDKRKSISTVQLLHSSHANGAYVFAQSVFYFLW